ncbi:MAG: hypothetical protein AAF682_11485 [Planctomycetota bacterium]
MWTGRPDTAATWRFELCDAATSAPVGRVELESLSDRGVVHADGAELRVARTRPLIGPFALLRGDDVLARAVPRRLGFGFRVEHGGGELELRVAAAEREALAFEVVSAEAVVGRLRHDGTLNRRLTVEPPAELALELQLFLLWPALLTWRREPSSWGGLAG